MSFEDGFTIQEIAAFLVRTGDKKHGTVKRVSSLLAEASTWLLQRDKALAAYESETTNFGLADKLREKFPVLENVLVTRSAPASPEAAWEPILDLTPSKMAAQYFDALTEEEKGDEIRVAISGGELLLNVATAIPHHQRQHVHYYASAMVGRGRMLRATHIGPETNAALCWLQSGMISGNLHYPTVAPEEVATGGRSGKGRLEDIKQALIKSVKLQAENDALKPVLTDLAEVNMMILDIGTILPFGPKSATSDLIGMPSLLQQRGMDLSLLAEEGAIGHLSYALFDPNGEGRNDWRFFLNAGDPDPIGFYRQMVEQKHKVIVVAESNSDPALRAALKGRLFNVLITDEATAHSLLAPSPPRWRSRT
jgi:DNA-binding transcriptional regulator LsrR (DeoR family)